MKDKHVQSEASLLKQGQTVHKIEVINKQREETDKINKTKNSSLSQNVNMRTPVTV